jgi:hypothetical protein
MLKIEKLIDEMKEDKRIYMELRAWQTKQLERLRDELLTLSKLR